MEGSVRKRGKTWSYYFFIGTVDGKKKYKEKGGFKTKGEASKALNEALYEFENGGYIAPKKLTFASFTLEWLDSYVKPLRKIATYNRYKELYNKYLANSLGGKAIIEIESYHIEKLLLSNKNRISGTTLQAIYTLINTIMNRALKLRIIKDNPCKYIERPQRDKFTPDVLDTDDLKPIFNVLDLNNEYDYMFNIAFRITLELGLRRGELGGLEWKDIDFKSNLIYVRNNLIYTNGHVKMETPKTIESERSIYISDELLKLLEVLKERQEQDGAYCGEFYEKNIFDDVEYDFVMKWHTGKYIHPMYYTNKLKKVLTAANINKSVRFHDLRHTNATLLLQQGIDFKVIQTRLGHSDIGTTMNIYSHVNKDMQKKATDKLSKLINI